MTDNTNSESNSTDTSLQDKILKYCETLSETGHAFLIMYASWKIAAGDLSHELAELYERLNADYLRRGFDPMAISAAAEIEFSQDFITKISSTSIEDLTEICFDLQDVIINGEDDEIRYFTIRLLSSELIFRGSFALMRMTDIQSDLGITTMTDNTNIECRKQLQLYQAKSITSSMDTKDLARALIESKTRIANGNDSIYDYLVVVFIEAELRTRGLELVSWEEVE
jgi:hypothetical protein